MKYALILSPFAWVFISILFFAVGEYLSKRWALKPDVSGAVWAIVFYAIGSALWLPALLEKNELVLMGRLWLLMGTIASMAVGLFIFREQLTVINWVGVGLSIIALMLLSV